MYLYLTLVLLHFQHICVKRLGTVVATVGDCALCEVVAVDGVHGGVLICQNFGDDETSVFHLTKEFIEHVGFSSCRSTFPVVPKPSLGSMREPCYMTGD